MFVCLRNHDVQRSSGQDPNIKVKRGDIGQIPKLNQTLGSKGGFKHNRVGDNPPGAHSGSDGSALGLDQPLGL